MTKVGILNYGLGNIQSVKNILDFLSIENYFIHNEIEIKKISHLIIPGVGSFKQAMINLKKQNLISAIKNFSANRNKFVLGICLGMQLLGKDSSEDGKNDGLGLINMSFDLLPKRTKIKIPHVGFNSVKILKDEQNIFRNINDNSDFYFNHSYATYGDDEFDAKAVCDYGVEFLAAFKKNNIFGSQFHPEKSQSNGIKIISNFILQKND